MPRANRSRTISAPISMSPRRAISARPRCSTLWRSSASTGSCSRSTIRSRISSDAADWFDQADISEADRRKIGRTQCDQAVQAGGSVRQYARIRPRSFRTLVRMARARFGSACRRCGRRLWPRAPRRAASGYRAPRGSSASARRPRAPRSTTPPESQRTSSGLPPCRSWCIEVVISGGQPSKNGMRCSA